MEMDSDLLNASEYAKLLGMHKNSLYRASREALHYCDRESLYFPSLIIGSRKYYSKSRITKRLNEVI